MPDKIDDHLRDSVQNNENLHTHLRLVQAGIERMLANYTLRSIDVHHNQPVFSPRYMRDHGGVVPGLLSELRIGISAREWKIYDPPTPQYMSEEEEGYGENHLIVHRPANDKFHPRLGVPDVHFEQPDGGKKKEPEPYYLVLKPSNKEGPIEEMRESMLSDIRELKARGANLICFNELSYPGFTYPIVDDSTFKTPSDLDLNNIRNKQKERDRVFRDEVQALANGTPGDDSDPPCIIVAGTFHDAATLRNICPIFFPETVNSDDSLYYHEKQTQALDYRKNGFLRLPKKREIPVYLTDLGTMMVHVCFDVVDLNLFMNQFRQPNRSGFQPTEVPAIVVVPAHTESDQVREACKDLSKSASCIVIYSNPLDTVTGAIFHCGATARQFNTQGIHYDGDSFGSSEAVENCNLVRRTRLEERESAQNTLSTIISPTG